MKTLGYILIAVGVVMALFALNMNVSVVTDYGGRVNNLGLMNDRQNYILIAAALFVGGVIAAVFGVRASTNERKCPFCAEHISIEAIKCKHCGSALSDISLMGHSEEADTRLSASDFTRYDANNNLVLNDDAINAFANTLRSRMPGHTALAIIVTNELASSQLKAFMPSEMASQFEVKLEKYLNG